MRIDGSLNVDRTYFKTTAKPSSAFQISDKSGVSREERQHLLAGKAQASKEEKVTNTYSERAQLLSSNNRTQRSWIA
jgi:hypothetical protein